MLWRSYRGRYSIVWCRAGTVTTRQRAQANGEPYHLLLLDGRMPGMDGLQVAAALTHAPRLAGMTIMRLTSDSRAGDIARCHA